jgi:heme oxygenase
MILHRLKQETSVYHIQIERDLILLQNNIAIDTYCHMLQRFWGFYCPVEKQIGMITIGHTFDFEQRRKRMLLELDLQALGVSSLPPTCENLPALQSMAQAIGCLYVLEGATLGGRIIAKHIEKILGLGPQNGCAFFHSYGRDVGSMWRSFGALVMAYAAESGTEEIIVLSACETFKKLRSWLLKDDV